MADTSKRTYNITARHSVDCAFLFSESSQGLTAKQVANYSHLPANLEAAGFLNCSGNVYHLGIACFAVGQAALSQLDIRRVSLRYLQELNRQTRETVHLTVRPGASAVYVEKLDSTEQLRIYSRIGAVVTLYCTAVGKVMLAYMSDEAQKRLLSQLPLKRYTPNTVGNLQQLEAELHRIRKNGYAGDLEEHELHIRCVATRLRSRTSLGL